MSDIVIRAENLGKSYLIGHEKQERYTALRDVLANKAKQIVRKTGQIFRGGQIMSGNELEEFWALKDVNFELKQGDRLGIIGRNGAGKSTLLKVLSRITDPTAGRIQIKGRSASLLEVGTGFHPELSGRENIYLNGAILGMSRIEIKKRFDEIVDFSGVEKFLDTPVKRYSSGMHVRLAFSVAAHLESDILIVDEVLAVGDFEFQKKCLGKMEEVSIGGGRTVLFVSHNMGAVRSLCTKGILIGDGKITKSGSIDHVIDEYVRPSNKLLIDQTTWSTHNDNSIPLQVLSVGITDKEGVFRTNFDATEEIHLIISHKCNEVLIGSTVLVSIFHNGIEMIHSFDTDIFANRLAKRNIGNYTDCIVIPKGLFKAGIISISIRTALLNKGITIQDETDVLKFDLEDLYEDTSFKGYAGNRDGILRISPLWKNVEHD